jgi:glycerophosphoryl diester phosphodiesterase
MRDNVSFPNSWWSHRPLIFAHRGASRRAPENTLAAFAAAMEVGADGVELDVHLSADGVPVVIHNARVDATTDGVGWVNDMTLDALKRLDAGVPMGGEFAGETIPTLEEVLNLVGDRLLINIELKAQSRKDVDLEFAVGSLVARMGLQDRVWYSSFKPYTLYTMRHLARQRRVPGVPAGLLYGPLSWGALFLVPFTPFEALHPHASLVHRWWVSLAHVLALKVVVWTVDDVSAAQKLVADGVDVIISNVPGSLIQALRSTSPTP